VSLLGAPARKPRERASYLRGWEHRREKEEAVLVNLSPDEIVLWRKIKNRFKGSPHERFEKFKHYVHEHPEELRRRLGEHGEERAKALVRKREAAPFVNVPCEPPWRYRTKAACNPEAKRPPPWSLLPSGRRMDVPCAPPHRFRVKELCEPKERRWSPPAEEHEHAFAGLL
jgi:hypothetical protein